MIDIDNRQNEIEVTDEINFTITNAIETALKHKGFDKPYEVSVVITNNLGIKSINYEFRNIDKETDVLSFPMHDFMGNYYSGEGTQDFNEEINPENGNIVLGDIVLSIEKAVAQASEYGHSLLREIAFLTVHSTLHLLGHDHENDTEREFMRCLEEDILSIMKLTR